MSKRKTLIKKLRSEIRKMKKENNKMHVYIIELESRLRSIYSQIEKETKN